MCFELRRDWSQLLDMQKENMQKRRGRRGNAATGELDRGGWELGGEGAEEGQCGSKRARWRRLERREIKGEER